MKEVEDKMRLFFFHELECRKQITESDSCWFQKPEFFYLYLRTEELSSDRMHGVWAENLTINFPLSVSAFV
jgi:hypothetical protein